MAGRENERPENAKKIKKMQKNLPLSKIILYIISMNKLSLILVFALVLFANTFAQKGKHELLDYANSPNAKEQIRKERNLTDEQKHERKRRHEKELENCRVVCENEKPVVYDGDVKVTVQQSECATIAAYSSLAKHHKQNKRVAETCGK